MSGTGKPKASVPGRRQEERIRNGLLRAARLGWLDGLLDDQDEARLRAFLQESRPEPAPEPKREP